MPLSVAVWAHGGAEQQARQFAAKHGLTSTVLVDANNQTVRDYHVSGVPTNVVIGKDGTVRYIGAGFVPSAMRSAIDAALRE